MQDLKYFIEIKVSVQRQLFLEIKFAQSKLEGMYSGYFL